MSEWLDKLEDEARKDMIETIKLFDPSVKEHEFEKLPMFKLQVEYNRIVLGSYRVVGKDSG